MKRAKAGLALILGLALAPMSAPAATGPAEEPPADHVGDSYVDSAGCLFRRATVNGRTVWAAQLDATGQPRCDAAAGGGAPAAAVPQPTEATAAPPLPDTIAAQPAHVRPGRDVLPARRHKPPYADAGYVQVGAFRLEANADRAAARLAGLGMPAARARDRIGSQPVTIVLAGPFDDAPGQQAALLRLRAEGFADAYLP